MSYNFPTADVTATSTHLSNQMYTICIRREANRRAICYTAFIDAAASPAKQNSFGISVAAAAMKASSNTECTTDYIEITSAIDQASVLTQNMPLLGANPA